MKEVLIAVLFFLVNDGVVSPGSCQKPQQQQQQPTGRLLKVPRIYNALITTDEELIPSQAYPAVAPVLRPAIPHYGPLLVYNDTGYGADFPPAGLPPPAISQQREETPQPPPLYSLQAQPSLPNIFDDRVKNNRNPNIPDVPPPPLPVKPQQLPQPRKPSNDQQDAPQRPPPSEYPPAPSLPFF